MPGNGKQANWLLGLVGAVGGAALGYFAFFLLARQDIYGLVLPGALLGLGCGALSAGKTNVLGIVCGVLALLLGVFTEWQFQPFIPDESFGFFITHLQDLKSITLVLIAAGGLFGFWFGRGREGGVWPRRSKRVVESERPAK
jgi:hypothetical protein